MPGGLRGAGPPAAARELPEAEGMGGAEASEEAGRMTELAGRGREEGPADPGRKEGGGERGGGRRSRGAGAAGGSDGAATAQAASAARMSAMVENEAASAAGAPVAGGGAARGAGRSRRRVAAGSMQTGTSPRSTRRTRSERSSTQYRNPVLLVTT